MQQPPASPRPPSPGNTRRGIRFQLSTLLLLSTLNGLVLASAAVAIFSSLTGDTPPVQRQLREVQTTLSAAHNELLLLALPGSTPTRGEEILTLLDETQQPIVEMGEPAQQVRLTLSAYQRLAREWLAWIGDHPGLRHSDSGSSPPEGQSDPLLIQQDQLAQQLATSYRTTLGELALLMDDTKPAWVEMAIEWAPGFMAWVLIVAIGTTIMAFRVQTLLSDPLENLQRAASKVGEGTLDVQIPHIKGAPEIESLAHHVESMRARLVWSLQKMNTRNAELSSILNSLHEAVYVLDPRGNVVELNDRGEQVIKGREGAGLPPRRGAPLRMTFPELGVAFPEGYMGQLIPITFTLQGGARRHLELRLTPLLDDDDTDHRSSIAVVRDVTEIREVEDLKRDFLSVITHELKTPLTAIEGYTKLLLMGKGGVLTERQRSFAQTIASQTLALKEMIQNLLDSTRLEGGNLPFNLQPLEAADALTQAVDSLRAAAQNKNISLDLDITSLGRTAIQADPFRLQQVLGNLIGNALKFTEAGGSIFVSGFRREGNVVLEVKDTGRGIPADAVPRLFEKFYQVDRGDTRIAGGAGLGLYICRQLVQAQGGTIAVDSSVGVGSRFQLTFPELDAADGVKESI